MVSRKRFGLIFSHDEQWMGGTYYTINLIQAFKVLPDNQQPSIIVFSNPGDYIRLENETKYPYLNFQLLDEKPLPKWKRGANKISSHLFGKRLFFKQYMGHIDTLFLFQDCGFLNSVPIERRLYWIPDFQDKHLPHYFTAEGLKRKDEKSRWIAENAHHLILSSYSVLEDWKTFYPNHRCNVSVVHFAVTHPPFAHISIDALSKRYQLPQVYFFSPNQFWAHKNHMVVIKAAELLKNSGTPVVIAFSGKENDNRNPGYAEGLKAYVQENQLYDVIRFLGFLDRSEQLQLMKHSKAVIQSSLFEGWSTVIEDAMALDKIVLASDLNVNKEQLGDYGVYFNPSSADDLAKQINQVLTVSTNFDYNYSTRLLSYAENMIDLIH